MVKNLLKWADIAYALQSLNALDFVQYLPRYFFPPMQWYSQIGFFKCQKGRGGPVAYSLEKQVKHI